jgi:NDP-sugar pyrophosphorylase family protein
MKCLIYFPEKQAEWLKEFFGDLHPYFLKILNKPLLEYYIDFCVLSKITQIRIIKNDPANELEEYFSDGLKWGVDLSYSLARKEDDLSRIMLKNSGFCKDEDLLIIYGYHFINYDREDEKLAELNNVKKNWKLSEQNSALYFIKQSEKPYSIDLEKLPEKDFEGVSLTILDSIGTYYMLSQDILRNRSKDYFLPGFSNESDEFVGMNVIYNPHTVSFQKPIMIGDNVQIKNHSFIGPNTILGNNVIIDSSSNIIDSIVYDQSYIGSDLDIENKVIYQEKLINPLTGSSMEITDKFYISKIDQNIFSRFFRKLIHSIIALILIILYALPNAIFGLLEVLGGSLPKSGDFYINSTLKVIKLPVWKLKRPRPLTLMFMRFALDKYPLLFSVVFGKLLLVGNRLQPVTKQARNLISNMKAYDPGVFDYPGMFSACFSEEETEMHERYYLHHKNIAMDIKIIISTLFGRFFNVGNYIRNKSYQ